MTAPELADGQTFYRFTTSNGDFRFASRADTRRAMMRSLRHFRLVAGLESARVRAEIVDSLLADDAWLRSRSGSVIAAVGRDAVDVALARVTA